MSKTESNYIICVVKEKTHVNFEELKPTWWNVVSTESRSLFYFSNVVARKPKFTLCNTEVNLWNSLTK